MLHFIRTIALSLALAATPACAALQSANVDNPVATAATLDQRAYAVLHAYAALIEEASDIVRDPRAPIALKRALGLAERAATPAAETLQIAVVAYLRAQSDFNAAANGEQSRIQRAATALSAAARRLNEAVEAARRPVSELEALVRAARN